MWCGMRHVHVAWHDRIHGFMMDKYAAYIDAHVSCHVTCTEEKELKLTLQSLALGQVAILMKNPNVSLV